MAYERWMAQEREKIADLEAELTRVCPLEVGGATTIEEAAVAAFEQTHKEILRILNKSEGKFKQFKAEAKKWEQERNRLEKLRENLRKSERPAPEVEEADKAFEEHLEGKPKLKWMVEARDLMRNPHKMKQGQTFGDILS